MPARVGKTFNPTLAKEMMVENNLLSMQQVHKSFPGVHALKGVDFSCRRGEVHALIGHNGAGKSTLIKILGGVYLADRGEISFNGRPFKPSSPLKAANAGISIIHQEFNLIPDLTVAQNIFLGREPKRKWGFLDYKKMYEGARQALKRLNVADIEPQDFVRELSVNQLQLVEIAKALSVEAEIIVMDEPTAALPQPDVQKLFDTVRELKAADVAAETVTIPFHDVDRARLDGDEEGFVQIHVREGKDEILGATIAAPHAGDLIAQVTQAMKLGVGLEAWGDIIFPYQASRNKGRGYCRIGSVILFILG